MEIGDKVYCKTKDRGYLPGIIVNKGNRHAHLFHTEKTVWHVSINGDISYWTESHMLLVEDFPEDVNEARVNMVLYIFNKYGRTVKAGQFARAIANEF